jgi:hypothetical protein
MVSHEAPSTSELLLIVKPNVYLVRPQVLQTYGFSERMWTTLRRKWKGLTGYSGLTGNCCFDKIFWFHRILSFLSELLVSMSITVFTRYAGLTGY